MFTLAKGPATATVLKLGRVYLDFLMLFGPRNVEHIQHWPIETKVPTFDLVMVFGSFLNQF